MLILMKCGLMQDLPAKDSNGFSDPCAKLFYTNRMLIKLMIPLMILPLGRPLRLCLS
jgi:hypothetical protein